MNTRFCVGMSLHMIFIVSVLGCATKQSAAERHFSVLANGGGLVTSKINAERGEGENMGGANTEAKSCEDESEEENSKLVNHYLKTLEACRFVLSGYETDSLEAKRERRWIMLVGAFAGSVVVPGLAAKGAAKSTIAAWGGLSGVSNVASHTMETEGLDARYYLDTRDNVRKSLDAAIKNFISDKSNYCTRRSAVAEMAAACTSYSVSAPPKN